MAETDIRGAQVIPLVSLVDYQAGAVVSKEILRRPSGTVTLFAFDKGQGLSEHTAPYDAMVQVLDGRVEITIAGEPYQVSAGEILIMPADRPHALHGVEPFKMLLTMIRS